MFHGRSISISCSNELNSIGLNRDVFLSGELKSRVSDMLTKRSELLFLGNDVSESYQKNDYKLTIHGILPCGSKTTLMVSGINPYVALRLDKNETESSMRRRISSIVDAIGQDDDCMPTKIMFKEGKDFIYYSHEASKYAEIYFKSMGLRKKFINECKYRGLKMYCNEPSQYFRVVARDYEINLSGWNILRNYKKSFSNHSKAKYILEIDINDIECVKSDAELLQLAESKGFDYSVFKYENLILSSFDIEMIPFNLNTFPDADKNPKDTIFMICMTYHFVTKPDSIVNVILTLKNSEPIDDAFTIHCRTEQCLLAAFARVNSLMQPDVITEFNGGGFDWRNVITKAHITGCLNMFIRDMSLVRLQSWETSKDNVYKFYHRQKCIKLGANEYANNMGLKLEGFIAFDTMIVCKQMSPKEDSYRLNECLRRANLGSKDDLEVREMFRIYREGSTSEMKLVSHYCYIDTVVLQRLILKMNVLQDRREVANMSYTCLQDNFDYAGGCKMRNLLMNRGRKQGYYFDSEYKPTISDPEAKFPGAFVVPPIKGTVKPMLRLDEYSTIHELNLSETDLQEGFKFISNEFNDIYHSDNVVELSKVPSRIRPYIEYAKTTQNQYPVSGLDFASLYPSIIMTYNISPEKLIIDESYARELESQGKILQFVKFPYCDKQIRAWFVRHNNDDDDMSVCGKLLIELFNRRATLKKEMKHYGELVYEMEQQMKQYSEETFPRIDEYNEAKFDYARCDSKQRAVKVFMNTLYGEMGNKTSCICAIEVSGSITTMGRYNLKLMKSFTENKLSMKVYYGDTDSLYVSCNPRFFIDYDQDYFTGKINKLTYATKLVEETFIQIEKAKNSVNDCLLNDNGSKFLKMAYEEVLYPVSFLGKKKYYGVPHEENVDFYPRKLFIRGLEFIKQGVSDILKETAIEAVRKVVDLHNNLSMVEILEKSIFRMFNTDWSIDSFVKSKSYKLNVDNKSVNTMIQRYRAMNYHSIPEANTRFKYVVCKYYPWSYDIEGRQKILTVGDCMELVERVREENLKIDLEYYFDHEFTGQFARLITFLPEFDNVKANMIEIDESLNENEKEALMDENYKRFEEAQFKEAKKFIGRLAKQYNNSYKNKGKLFSNTYREVSTAIRTRPYLMKKNMPVVVWRLLSMFENNPKSITDGLMEWAGRYMASQYHTTLTSEQMILLRKEFVTIEQFLVKKNHESQVLNYVGLWKENIVKRIREEYDYDLICKHGLPYENIYDVLTVEELNIILTDIETRPLIDVDIAMETIDKISHAIAFVVKYEQVGMK